ncbi:MAG TPA: PEP/pyruvate-binding domain-containing protein [Anaerolineales bacterium]|nr:PEP/pyruvate-binding domain-containing protein [Anaerolineales bacterium]
MNIYWLGTSAAHDPGRVGGKAANLSRLAAKYPVPPGFCLEARLDDGGSLLEYAGGRVMQAYHGLGRRCGCRRPSVAVRSSAVDEDGRQASFAGQHESYLNVVGSKPVARAVQRCVDSAHTERAQAYRNMHGLSSNASVAVLIQQFILADVSAVVFSADPVSGRRTEIVINATWGLGESLVGGTVTPDLYRVQKATLDLVDQQLADKTYMTIACPEGTREVPVPRAMQTEPTLNLEQVKDLARLALALEKYMGWPVDLECAFQQGRLYLLQCRPITTLSEAIG